MPAADAVLLQWSESGTVKTASAPGVIGTGRQWVYRVGQVGRAATLSNLVLSLRSGTGKPSAFAVPSVQVPVAGH